MATTIQTNMVNCNQPPTILIIKKTFEGTKTTMNNKQTKETCTINPKCKLYKNCKIPVGQPCKGKETR